MINIKAYQCLEDGCNKEPCYGYINDKRASYCKNHSKKDMINIISERCIENNCSKLPSFNYINETKAIYCVLHKKEKMVDIKNKNKQCKKDGWM
jgi:hypothetical protein